MILYGRKLLFRKDTIYPQPIFAPAYEGYDVLAYPYNTDEFYLALKMSLSCHVMESF